MRNFYKGQKVVCIQDDLFPGQLRHAISPDMLQGLKKGQIYTIRWVGEVNFPGNTYIGIKIEEIKRDCFIRLDVQLRKYLERWIHTEHGSDIPYHSDRFAPLIKTDISVFEAMLNPTDQLEEV